MLTEIWLRQRGYDKWVQTEATILSSELAEPDAGLLRSEKSGKLNSRDQFYWHSTCVIGWKDGSDSFHTASYSVPEWSQLFQLYEGQTVFIRYNPACPGEYYLRELSIYKAALTLHRILRIAFIALSLIWFALILWRRFH